MSDHEEVPSKEASIANQEEEFVLRTRYQELVNQKYLRGLSTAEQAEMEELDRALDAFDAPFYQPMIEYLQRQLAQKRQAGD